MPVGNQPGMQCAEFDALLADALDGTLSGSGLMRFETHKSGCASCAAMFEEVNAGMKMLHALPEVEAPSYLVNSILAATTGVHASEVQAVQESLSWHERLREKLAGALRPLAVVVQPKFAMSFGMAVFTMSLALNITGFKMSSLRHVDLRPSAIVRNYYETSGRLVKYYENIRFVYEIETRVREFKRATSPDTPADQNKDQKDKKKNGEPDQRNYQNFSREDSHPVLASCPACALSDWISPYRREA